MAVGVRTTPCHRGPQVTSGPTHFILWASSQLAWTCCSACRIGVWLKTVEEVAKKGVRDLPPHQGNPPTTTPGLARSSQYPRASQFPRRGQDNLLAADGLRGVRGVGYVQFCLVLVRLRRRLSRCSRICSRVSWASLLLELRRLRAEKPVSGRPQLVPEKAEAP